MDEQLIVEQQVWEAPNNRFIKTITSKGYGYYCPQDGSVCKIKVISDEMKILSEVNEDMIKELIVGDVDDPIDRLVEACLRTMKNEEICILKFPDPSQPLKSKDVISAIGQPFSEPVTPTKVVDLENIVDAISMKDEDSHSVIPEKNIFTEKSSIDMQNTDNCIQTPCNDEQSTNECIQTPCNDEQSIDNCIQTSCNDVEGCSEGNSSIPNETPADEKPEIQDVPNIELCESESNARPEDTMEVDSCDGTTAITYEVHLQLLCYTREPEIWEMSITEKWRRANYHKQKGMELYARGSYEWAFRRFGLSLKYIISLEQDVPSGQEEGMNIAGLKLSCYLNLAACQMRHYNYSSVVTNCTKALEIQSDNSKALYRRGSAYTQLQDYEKAKEDLNKALEHEPKNQAIVKQQQILKARVQKLNDYYASVMKKMFL